MDVQEELKSLGIKPSVGKDQFFLKDKSYVKKAIEIAGITKNDRVLEVGPGMGILTEELVKTAKEVLAIEIDEQFRPVLDKIGENVEVVYGNAYRLLNDKSFLRKTKAPTKTISSIPYSQAQNMLHNYTNNDWYEGDIVWIAPVSLAEKINKEIILSSYYQARIVELIPKTAFFPEPNTNSAIVYFERIENPLISKNMDIYLRRWFYNHEDCKVKNTIREGIIKLAFDLKGIRVTKNEARELIDKLGLSEKELNKLMNNMNPNYYYEIPQKLEGWYKSLA